MFVKVGQRNKIVKWFSLIQTGAESGWFKTVAILYQMPWLIKRKRERHDQWWSQKRHSHNPSILTYTVSKQQSISLKEGELALVGWRDGKVYVEKIMLLDLTFFHVYYTCNLTIWLILLCNPWRKHKRNMRPLLFRGKHINSHQ